MRIAVIGSGYVGLTTGSCLAALGHSVTCTDQEMSRIDALKRGNLPIYEPGLGETFAESVADGRLRFAVAPEGVDAADAVFITVGTPSLPDGDIDLRHVEEAARDIARLMKPGAVIVVKSTVVAGTAAKIRAIIRELRGDDEVSVVSNPEFLREGSAVRDFMCPDRIVVGADDPRSAETMRALYRPLTRQGVAALFTTTENAELIKYAANAFLALKIGFVNDVSELCERLGGDIVDVVDGVGLDRRIGPQFLSPGPGFGGSCFPKDTRAFAATGRRHGVRQGLIETLVERNEQRKASLADRVIAEGALKRGDRVAVLGLAFKANTDDVREAAALTIIPRLQQAGIRISAHDPQAMRNTAEILGSVAFCNSPYEAAAAADAVVILTEWNLYKELDLTRLAAAMRGRMIFDFRNLLSPHAAARAGFTYASIGRASIIPGAPRPSARNAGAGARIAAVAEPAR